MNYLYAINFAPGFEGLVAVILKRIEAEVIFAEEAFALIRYHEKVDLDSLRFAKSVIEVFDHAKSFKDLRLSLPGNLALKGGRTFNIRNFESGRPVKMDEKTRRDLIMEVSNKAKIKYSAFEPDIDFVVAKRRDGFSYFGCKVEKKNEPKPQKGEINSDVANLLIELGEMRDGCRVLDAFGGYGGISKELVVGFDPVSVTVVERNSTLVNKIRSGFGSKSKVRVIASDAVNFLKSTELMFDLIIADPPWGDFGDNQVDLGKMYADFLAGASKKLSSEGRLVIMSSSKELLEGAVEGSSLTVEERLNVLVSGKKVLVLKLAYGR